MSLQRRSDQRTRFHVENLPDAKYLVILEISSERRHYIPIGFVSPEVSASNLVKVGSGAKLFHFGIGSGQMHMACVRSVGRAYSRKNFSGDADRVAYLFELCSTLLTATPD